MNTLFTKERYVLVSRLIWSSMLVLAAMAHFFAHDAFAAYYPSYLPLRDAAITGTGVVEIALAILLWTSRQRLAWLLICILMIIYFPVHLYVVTDHASIIDPPYFIPLWLAWARLFMQGGLIAWTAHLASPLTRTPK